MLEQEGDKPHLTLVGADDVVSDYSTTITQIITTLTQQKMTGKKVDVYGSLTFVDPKEDNNVLRDWLATNDLLPKPAFDKLLRKIARDSKLIDELGFIPTDVLHFVTEYAKRKEVVLSVRGTIKRQRAFKFGEADIDARNADTNNETKLIFDVANAQGDNLDSFARELRLTSSKLGLNYRDTEIMDALVEWNERTVREIKVQTMFNVQFTKGAATGPIGQEMWESIEKACFNVGETRPGFAIAVLKKFMWQVKRKARGMPVTNHLMPVLTGPQGKGKSEFVKAMTRPLHDLMREVDFGLITDGKTADIWASYILFIDEMGWFERADVDKVKNIITAESQPIRTMRTNHSTAVANNSTLIGCSNKSLAQLIRDDTGVRRFAELLWTSTPDWETLNKADWMLLWQSVNENEGDPLVEAGMMDVLRAQQEENRAQSPIEMWAREFGTRFKEWTKAADLHEHYRMWEKEKFPRAETNVSIFGKTLTNLIATMPDFPMEKKQRNNGINYRLKESTSV